MLSMILAHDLPCYRTVIKMVSGALLEGGISKYREFMKKKPSKKYMLSRLNNFSSAECRASVSFSLLSNEYLSRDRF